MRIPFTTFFERLLQATDITTQMDLARALGVNRSAITQAKLRDAVPQNGYWPLRDIIHFLLTGWNSAGAIPVLRHTEQAMPI